MPNKQRIRIEGDLQLNENMDLEVDLEVSGNISGDHNLRVGGRIIAQGHIVTANIAAMKGINAGKHIEVTNLFSEGIIAGGEIRVSCDIIAKGEINSGARIIVNGEINSLGDITSKEDIISGGDINAKGKINTPKDIYAGGDITSKTSITARDISFSGLCFAPHSITCRSSKSTRTPEGKIVCLDSKIKYVQEEVIQK